MNSSIYGMGEVDEELSDSHSIGQRPGPYQIYQLLFPEHTYQMRKRVLPVILLFTCCLMGIQAFAQISFSAASDAKQVLVGEYVTVSFTLVNTRGSNLRTPDFKGLKLISGPNQAFRQSNINGRLSFQTTYSYVLQPTKAGKLEIGSASITADGKLYTTEPLTIEVLENERTAEAISNAEPVFVRLEMSTDTAYIGEQVTLDYKLFTTMDVRNFDIRYVPDYENCYAININYHNFPQQREVIDGQSYVTKVMRRIALFPQQTGKVEIGPATINLGIEYEDPNSRSFFFNTRVKFEAKQTNIQELVILPQPPNAPNSFSGAVGNYAMRSRLDRTTGKTNEAFSIFMSISGNGDEKRLVPPVLDLGPEFEVYDPKLVNANNVMDGPFIEASKQVEYLVVPKQVGEFVLRPAFTYLDPATGVYQTLQDSLPIRILQGNELATTPLVEAQQGDDGLAFISLNARWKPIGSTFFGTVLHWFLMLLPFLGIMGALFWKRKQLQLANIDPTLLKQSRAQKVALSKLEKAQSYLDQQDARGFFDEISKASLGYVADKLLLTGSELDKQIIQSKLASTQVSEDIQERFNALLITCEMALFGGMSLPEKMQQTFDEAKELIVAIEESAVF